MTISFAPEAEADFAAVVGYLVERNPVAASEFAAHIFRIIDRLAQNEFDGPEQTLVSGEVVRSWPVPPVRIYYQRRPGAFWVLRIYHQSTGADRSIASLYRGGTPYDQRGPRSAKEHDGASGAITDRSC